MTMTRRLFSMFLPAAPSLAGEVGKVAAEKVFQHIDSIKVTNAVESSEPIPATYSEYRKVERQLNNLSAFRYRRNSAASKDYETDPNIMALKSVSIQHKAIMHLKQEERLEKSNRSYLDKIAEELGLKEFFAKSPSDSDQGYIGSPRSYTRY